MRRNALSSSRKTHGEWMVWVKKADGVLQPFRFVALEDEDHRRLRTSLDHVVDRKLLGMKSSGFSSGAR